MTPAEFRDSHRELWESLTEKVPESILLSKRGGWTIEKSSDCWLLVRKQEVQLHWTPEDNEWLDD